MSYRGEVQPASIKYLKACCLGAFAANILFFEGLDVHFTSALIFYDASHLFNEKDTIQLLSIFGWMLLVLPILGFPYWLSLVYLRWNLAIAKYLLYLYDAFFLFMTLAGFSLIISAVHENLPILSAVLYELWYFAEALLVLFAILFLNERSAKGWTRRY